MDLHEYFGLCADHDWTYRFTNEPHRYKRGVKESIILMKYYKLMKYRDVYTAWCNFNLVADTEKPNYDSFLDLDQ